MLKKFFLVCLLAGTLPLLAVSSTAEATEFLSGPTVTIAAGEVVEDDVYAFGGTVVVNGTINGDLIASGGNIYMNGSVNGDVIAAGGNINIAGNVQDDVRVAGGQISVASTVGGDVIAGGGSLFVGGTVAGDVVTGAGNLQITGDVGGNVRLGSGEAAIDGIVRGNVKGDIENQLTLGPKARIEGDLDYQSRNEVKLDSGAQVLGSTTRTIPKTKLLGQEVEDSWLVQLANSAIGQVRYFLGTVLVGLLLLWIIPQVTRGVASTPVGSPWKSLGLGAGVLVAAPLAVIVAAGIAIAIGGFAAVPVLAVPVAIYLALLSLTAPIIAILVGAFVLGRSRNFSEKIGWRALLVGAVILAIVGLVPVVKVITVLLVILFGFGGWVLYLHRHYASARELRKI